MARNFPRKASTGSEFSASISVVSEQNEVVSADECILK